MRHSVLRVLLVISAVVLAGCQDAPTLPDRGNGDARLNTVADPEGATETAACCDPIIVVVPGPERCDPYLQLDFSCDDKDDPCMSGTGIGGDLPTIATCNDGSGPKPGLPGGGNLPTPPDDGDGSCDPDYDPGCERPLTPADLATINRALETMLRASEDFTDPEARQQCQALTAAFRTALSGGAVFRGAFDSNNENDPEGGHFGFTSKRATIHFDPGLLDAANAGNALATRQVAITALHEVGHKAGFQHGRVTWDDQGRDHYAERPFSLMNPGANSCVPR